MLLGRSAWGGAVFGTGVRSVTFAYCTFVGNTLATTKYAYVSHGKCTWVEIAS
jgi:hypothetical protein